MTEKGKGVKSRHGTRKLLCNPAVLLPSYPSPQPPPYACLSFNVLSFRDIHISHNETRLRERERERARERERERADKMMTESAWDLKLARFRENFAKEHANRGARSRGDFLRRFDDQISGIDPRD